jgi:hypothetical protein
MAYEYLKKQLTKSEPKTVKTERKAEVTDSVKKDHTTQQPYGFLKQALDVTHEEKGLTEGQRIAAERAKELEQFGADIQAEREEHVREAEGKRPFEVTKIPTYLKEGGKDVARDTMHGMNILQHINQNELTVDEYEDTLDAQDKLYLINEARLNGVSYKKVLKEEAEAYNAGMRESKLDFENKRQIIDRIAAPDQTYLDGAGFWEKVVRLGPQIGVQAGLALTTGPAWSAAFMGNQIFGSTYENARAKGAKHERAVGAGLMNTALQTPMEYIGMGKFTKFVKIRGPVAQKFKDLIETMGTEWFTEFAQAYPEQVANVYAENPDLNMLEATWESVNTAEKLMATAKQGAEEGFIVLPWTLLGASPRMVSSLRYKKESDERKRTDYLGHVPPAEPGYLEEEITDETTPEATDEEGERTKETEKQEESKAPKTPDETPPKKDVEIPIKKTKQPKIEHAMTSLPDVKEKDAKKADETAAELGLDLEAKPKEPTITAEQTALDREGIRKGPHGYKKHVKYYNELNVPTIAIEQEDGTLQYMRGEETSWTPADKNNNFTKVRAQYRKIISRLRKSGHPVDNILYGFYHAKHGFIDVEAPIFLREGDTRWRTIAQDVQRKLGRKDIKGLKERRREARKFGTKNFNVMLAEGLDEEGRAELRTEAIAKGKRKGLSAARAKAVYDRVNTLIGKTQKQYDKGVIAKALSAAGYNPKADDVQTQSLKGAAAEAIWVWSLNNPDKVLSKTVAIGKGRDAVRNAAAEERFVVGSREIAGKVKQESIYKETDESFEERLSAEGEIGLSEEEIGREDRKLKLINSLRKAKKKVKSPKAKKLIDNKIIKLMDTSFREVPVEEHAADLLKIKKQIRRDKERVPDAFASASNQILNEKEARAREMAKAKLEPTDQPIRTVYQPADGHGPFGTAISAATQKYDMEIETLQQERNISETEAEKLYEKDQRPDMKQFTVNQMGGKWYVVESHKIVSGVKPTETIIGEREAQDKRTVEEERTIVARQKLQAGKLKEEIKPEFITPGTEGGPVTGRKEGQQLAGAETGVIQTGVSMAPEQVTGKRISIAKLSAEVQKHHRKNAPPDSMEGVQKEQMRQINEATKSKKKIKAAKDILNNPKGSSNIINDFAGWAAEKIAHVPRGVWNTVTAIRYATDIESRFKGWAENSGMVTKNHFGIRAAHQIRANVEAKKITRAIEKIILKGKPFKRLTDRMWFDTVMIAENPDWKVEDETNREDYERAGKILRSHFESKREILKQRGYDPGNPTERLLKKAYDALEEAEPYTEEWAKAAEKISMYMDMNYIHIPTSVLWAPVASKKHKKGFVKEREGIDNLFNLLTLQERTASLTELFSRAGTKEAKEKGELSAAQRKMIELLSPAAVVMNYGNRFAKDMAKLDLLDTLKNDDAARKMDEEDVTIPSNWVKYNNQKAGVFQGYAVDARADEAMTALFALEGKRKWYDKVINMTKMFAFYNPFFLPIYDVYQSFMTGVHFRKNPGMTIWNLGSAIKHTWMQTPEYLEAMELGLFSKPFDFPFGKIQQDMKNITSGSNPAMSYLKSLGSIAGETKYIGGLGAVYKVSWDTAWKLDETVRMWTYLQLSNGGKKNKAAAAQTAARFHGDYASVPPKTRKYLNRIFFTPTFKLAMGKLYLNMLNSIWKAPLAIIKGQKTTEQQQQLMYLSGLISTAGLTYGFDAFMESLGYSADEDEGWWGWNFGRKYVRKAFTKWGPKEVTFTWSNPGNIMQRYSQRIARAALKIQKRDRPVLSTLEVLKWDLHPIYQTLWGALENRKPDGSKIWRASETLPEIAVNHGLHFLQGLVRISELGLAHIPDSLSTRNGSLVKREVNKLHTGLSIFVDNFANLTIAHMTVRDPKRLRLKRDLDRMKREFKSDQREHVLQHGYYNKQWLDNATELLKGVQKEIR